MKHMQCTCPECGHKADFSVFFDTSAARDVLTATLRYDGAVCELFAYINKFRTGKMNALTWEKALLLINELESMIEKGKFIRNGTEYKTDRAAVIGGIRKINRMEHLRLPFRNHALLTEILTDMPVAASGTGSLQVHTGAGTKMRGFTARGMYTVQADNVAAVRRFLEQ